MAQRKLEVILTGNEKDAQRAFAATERSAKGMGSKLSSIGKQVAKVGALAAVGIAGGIAAGLKSAWSAAAESLKIGRETERVIKTTGGAANVTAKQIADYSGSLSQLTGVDDELIQTNANLLLTFTNIKNEVGAGNDVFNQATAAALDMSTALGTDMKSASIQLGKALNDPTKGITALSKSGVSFTQDQKNMIKMLQASGDTMGAQKIILAELNKEFGGAAAAAATPLDRLKVTIGNIQEAIGARLIPIVDGAVKWFSERLPVAIDKAGAQFQKLRPYIDQARVKLLEIVGAIRPVIAAVVDFAKKNPKAIFAGLAVVLGGVLLAAIGSVAAAVLALLSPVVLVVAGVAALAAGLIYAYNRFEGFRNVVDAVASFLTGTVWPAMQAFAAGVVVVFNEVVGWVKANWPQISEAITHVMNVVRDVVNAALTAIKTYWDMFGSNVLTVIKTTWETISKVISAAISYIQGWIKTVMAVINGDWGKAWDGIKQMLGAAWDAIKGIVSGALGLLRNLLDAAWTGIKAAIPVAWEGIKSAIGAALDGIKTLAGNAVDGVVGFFTDLPGRIVAAIPLIGQAALGAGKAILTKIGEGISGAVGFVGDLGSKLWDSIRGFLNEKIDTIRNFKFSVLGKDFQPFGSIPRFHQGGTFRAPTAGGEGLALLRDRERILTPEQGISFDSASPAAAGPQSINVTLELDGMVVARKVVPLIPKVNRAGAGARG